MKRRDDAQASLSRRHFLAAATALAGGLMVTASALAQDAALGALIQDTARPDAGEGFDAAAPDLQMPRSSMPTLSPATVQATEQAIAAYQAFVARGGWPRVPETERLRLGVRHPNVVALRQRLKAGGDLSENDGVNDTFDSYVEAAVKRFQARHGVSVTGVVGEQTLKEMNVPAEVRLRQLETNLVRLRSIAMQPGARFVTVNIPATSVELVDNGSVESRLTAIVGKPDRQSPIFQSKISEVNFNPFWTVPVSIIRKDLIPKMQQDPQYLTKNKIRVYDPKGNEVSPAQINWHSTDAVNYRFRQDPGEQNSMGSVRINVPSSHGVYMHDTPQKSLFGEDFRFHSSGCIRVHNVREYVIWLLAGTPGWDRNQIDAVIKSGDRIDARMSAPVPIYWVYITAWATPDGVVQFRDDIYGHDGFGPMATTIPEQAPLSSPVDEQQQQAPAPAPAPRSSNPFEQLFR